MPKLFIALEHQPERYNVAISIYSDEGSLIEERVFKEVKQVVIKSAKEIRLSAQLASNPVVIVASIEKPIVELKHESILYISGEG
ncbi:MAG: hypothetical protein J7K21_05415 [Desulfurococcales archaeon]|nr:hypothetical protein [Desulfurococcales archaeon]